MNWGLGQNFILAHYDILHATFKFYRMVLNITMFATTTTKKSRTSSFFLKSSFNS